MNSNQTKSPTAIITGASQGIGRATALLLARQGYDLVLAARQVDRLEAIASEVRSLGRNVLAIPTDVQDPEQVQKLVKEALNFFPSIDVLINNAGIYLLAPVEDCSLSDWHQVINTNLWGYIHTIHAILPHFLEKGKGMIINVGSIGGKIPIAYQVPYTVSKYGVTGLTEALHAELYSKGITVCGVHPNFIKTSMLERAIFRGKNEQDIQSRRDLVANAMNSPLLENPEDVAQAIWHTLKHPEAEVLAGSAKISKASYSLFPGLMQWLFRKTFSTKTP